jgi:hypothetical protein
MKCASGTDVIEKYRGELQTCRAVLFKNHKNFSSALKATLVGGSGRSCILTPLYFPLSHTLTCAGGSEVYQLNTSMKLRRKKITTFRFKSSTVILSNT